MHTKTRYNYVDWPKIDQKMSKKIPTERFVSTFCIFPSKIFTDFVVVIYPRESDYFRFSLWYYKEQWPMSLILSFHLFSRGTFLNHHQVAQHVLNISFLITIRNSQFWRLQFTGIFVLTGCRVFFSFWLWQKFTFFRSSGW